MGLLLAALLALAPAESEPKGRLAQASLDRCEEKIAEDAREGTGYMCLYDVTRATSDHATIEARLRRALVEDADNPWPYLALGALLHDVGKADALEMYRKGLSRLSDEDTPLDHAMNHLNFAAILRHGGDDDGAKEQLDEARRYATKADHPGLLRATTVELARHLAFTGRNLAEVQRLLDGLGEIPPQEYQTRVNVALTRAERFRRLGALEDALAQHEAMAELATEQGDDYVLARALLSAAAMQLHLAARRLEPDREGLIETLERAHEAATRANHTYAQAQAMCRLAEFGGDAALARAQACMEGFIASEDAFGMVTSTATIAAVHRRRGDEDRYAQALAAVEARAAGLEDPQIRAMVLDETIRGGPRCSLDRRAAKGRRARRARRGKGRGHARGRRPTRRGSSRRAPSPGSAGLRARPRGPRPRREPSRSGLCRLVVDARRRWSSSTSPCRRRPPMR